MFTHRLTFTLLIDSCLKYGQGWCQIVFFCTRYFFILIQMCYVRSFIVTYRVWAMCWLVEPKHFKIQFILSLTTFFRYAVSHIRWENERFVWMYQFWLATMETVASLLRRVINVKKSNTNSTQIWMLPRTCSSRLSEIMIFVHTILRAWYHHRMVTYVLFVHEGSYNLPRKIPFKYRKMQTTGT